jgi:membrane protein
MIDIRKKINDFFLRELWELDTGSFGKFKRFFIKTLMLLNAVLREITESQLTLRAMSLVYSTLLSIVPILAISFSILKAFGVHNQVLEPFLSKFLDPLGEKGVAITSRIIAFIENMKVGVLGAVGLAMLFYTVLSVIQKIEMTFNYIWKVKRSRSFRRRFTDYTSVLLVGPVLIFAAAGLTASVTSNTIVQRLVSIDPFGTLFYYIAEILPYILVSAVFTFLYVFLPNTKVTLKSALFGGVFAGILWEVAGWGFTAFVVSSGKYTAIYSGFAILVMFLIWLYVSWLILLVGAQVAFYHQYPQLLSMKKEAFELNNRFRERLACLIMYFIGYNYTHNKRPWTLDSIVGHLNVPMDSILDIIMSLESKGLLSETGDDPPVYLPAKDIETITLKEIFSAVWAPKAETALVEERTISVPEVNQIINALDKAHDDTLAERTLKDIVFSAK